MDAEREAGTPRVDEAARALRGREPSWNDLREQRVLGRITEGRRARAPRRRKGIAGALGLAAAAAVALVAWRMSVPTDTSEGSDPARLALADGSVALLSADARVRVDAQGRDAVELTQESGSVTYQVTHDPARAFVVHAGSATVTVRGTRFVVAMVRGFVDVSVAQGRVAVEADGSTTLLSPGEAIRVRATGRPPATDPARGRATRDRPALDRPAPDRPAGRATRDRPALDRPATDRPAGRATRDRPAPDRPAGRATRDRPAPDRPAGRATRDRAATDRPASGADRVSPAPSTDRVAASGSGSDSPSAATLSDAQLASDAARRRGDVDRAADILRTALAAHPDDPGAQAAFFTLGRLERRRARHADAATAFTRARAADPDGPLAEDALAEQAASLAAAGLAAPARAAATEYLTRYPNGLSAPRMRALAP